MHILWTIANKPLPYYHEELTLLSVKGNHLMYTVKEGEKNSVHSNANWQPYKLIIHFIF